MTIQITSYNDAKGQFSRARDKHAGRPLNHSYRLFADGDDFEIRSQWLDICVCKIRPDNTVVFHREWAAIEPLKASLSNCLATILPLLIVRVGKNRYKLGSSFQGDYVWSTYNRIRTEGQEYFAGVMFDLETGKCLNPRPDEKFVVNINNHARKEWLRDLRRAKRDLKTRFKIGAMDQLIARARDEANSAGHWRYVSRTPSWKHGDALDRMISYMKTGEVDEDFLQRISKHYTDSHLRFQKDPIKYVDDLFKSISTELRRAYGVFDGAD